MLKRKYHRCKTTQNWQKYRTQRNIVSKIRKQSLNNYLKMKCNNSHGNGGEFWNVVKPMISHKSIFKNDNIILKQNDDVITKPNEIVDCFNEYFINMAVHIGPDDSVPIDDDVFSCVEKYDNHDGIVNIRRQMENNNMNSFHFSNINVDTVQHHLQKLNLKKATGCDMLPAKLLKSGSGVFCNSVCHLMNMSINSSKFPNALKLAEICPVLKKGNNLEVNNYRPVSILNSMSKIFERVIVNQLTDYFNNVCSIFLSGFRQQHSCETVLLRMIENKTVAR